MSTYLSHALSDVPNGRTNSCVINSSVFRSLGTLHTQMCIHDTSKCCNAACPYADNYFDFDVSRCLDFLDCLPRLDPF